MKLRPVEMVVDQPNDFRVHSLAYLEPEIFALEMQMLGSREGMGGGATSGGDDQGESRSASAPRAPAAKPAPKSATGFDDMDDDIPF